MSKRLILVLVMIVVLVSGLVVVGCAPPAPAPPAPAPPAPAPPAPAPPAPAPPAPAPAEVTTWRIQSYNVAGDKFYENAAEAMDRIEIATDGRLVFDFYSSGALVPACAEVEAVTDGTIEAADTSHWCNEDMFMPAGLFFQMVGGLSGLQMAMWYQVGDGTELANEMLEPLENVQFIVQWTQELPEVWGHFNIPIYGPNDLKGLKFRAFGDAGEILNLMGAATVYFPGGELYEAAARGVVDAFEYSTATLSIELGFWEVCEYMYLSPSRAPTDDSALFVNIDEWNALTPDIQEIIREIGYSQALRMIGTSIQQEAPAVEWIRAQGVVIAPLPRSVDEALFEAAEVFYSARDEADPFHKKVRDSQIAFKAMCEQQGVY